MNEEHANNHERHLLRWLLLGTAAIYIARSPHPIRLLLFSAFAVVLFYAALIGLFAGLIATSQTRTRAA